MANPARKARLDKLLNEILSGRQNVTAQNNANFIEAICVQADAPTCINSIICLPAGLNSIQESMRLDLSAKFFNGRAKELLMYLQTPSLANISGGSFLHQVILKIVEPPIFWGQFTAAFQTGQLQDDAQRCFAWLLLHMITTTSTLANPYLDLARDSTIIDKILASPVPEIVALGQQIKEFLDVRNAAITVQGGSVPGGRHDNDFEDFRAIAILPTADEIAYTKSSFLRSSSELDDPDTIDSRSSIYLDGQFRLLREDMLYEMKEEVQLALKKKKGRCRGMIIDGFTVDGIYCGPDGRRCKWGIALKCTKDLPIFDQVQPAERKAHLKNLGRKLKHQSLTCLVVDGDVVAFPTFYREDDLLCQDPPILVIQLDGDVTVLKVLLRLKTAKDIKLIQIDTAIFAFEPVLKALQDMKSVPLSPELLFWTANDNLREPVHSPSRIIDALRSDPRCDVGMLLNTGKSIILDASQAASLLSALTQKVSLIQGPPGERTGKSFIGALLAKALVDFTRQTILVVCYTNHALDQFLEDLVNIGISDDKIVRVGGKANAQTERMSLFTQTATFRRSKGDWSEIDALKARAEGLYHNLSTTFEQYSSSNLSNSALLDYLEFEDPTFYEAFLVPATDDEEMTMVGRSGQAMQRDYLLHRWIQGRNAGALGQHPAVLQSPDVWSMRNEARQSKHQSWKQAILEEQIQSIITMAREYDGIQMELARKFTANTVATLRSKRIIGCTTTGAAKYTDSIQQASPGVLLVEEAGEILESHVLTALGQATDQLILIGDHQQLRPKVNNYALTVEKGDGYDLNRSMFERLVLKGFPHQTLHQQHRMRPEISDLVRQLTYPHLIDAPKTFNRPSIRGLRDVIVHINHACPEDEFGELSDRRDMGSTSSKQNTFEVQMVLKIVKYLGQQGYGSDDIVILTPYLGQLSLLKTSLAKENDPLLNDLDSNELARAGLLTPGVSRMHKKPIRLATIDNYQGEESDIVVLSLTRSNSNHDIGFMFSPERLNVLLSRARNSLIMIGNASTFEGSRKGKAMWTKLFNMLREHGHFYDGLPVHCERHRDRIALLSQPVQFDIECPDGGCQEQCKIPLRCGHLCPLKCHQIGDHSKIPCKHPITWKCDQGHDQSADCHKAARQRQYGCPKCAADAKKAKAKLKREAEERERKLKQEAEQLAHEERMAEVQAKIDREQQAIQDARLAEDRAQALRQRQKDLQGAMDDAAVRAQQKKKEAKDVAARVPQPQPTLFQSFQASFSSSGSSPTQTSSSKPTKSAPAKDMTPSHEEWERQKRVEGDRNDAIDSIMGMIGLEDVKAQVLRIKQKIDVAKRQNVQLNDERFNIVFQGNPGTGKTTVARHYAKFLSSVGVLPGNRFIETTGSRLSNEGVKGIQGHIEQIENAGGGAIFVDEAYQLTSDYGQGKQVLDFLLAEMENKVGTIVFMFAGYKRELESFFEHNPGLSSRVPYVLSFEDYTDEEFLRMLEQLVHKKFNGRMKMEDDSRGLYARIAVRRLGRGRGTNGFGNARALQTVFTKIHERQTTRLQRERKHKICDDFLLTKEDIIGPDPSLASKESAAWKKLQTLIGLDSVKETVRTLIDRLIINYARELQELKPIETSLNRNFVGSPGTGKTTVAKLYGQILADLGLLSKGEVVVKNPSDFVGAHLGHSEKNTKAILATTVGKVLVIDEAYMLYSSGKHGIGNESDSFKTAVIDTLVAEIQSVPGEDRVVLLLGYEDKMVEMFQNVNPGLTRRFAIEDAFRFEDFTQDQLREILDLKLKEQDLSATDPAKIVALEVLARARNRPNFGNAGDVENLLGQAKTRHAARQRKLPPQDRQIDIVFEPRDFDAEFDRATNASANLAKLFEGIVGCDHIKEKLGNYQQIAVVAKERGMDPRLLVPMNFVFKGPPGTGKTTIARKMGEVYYDMGFLSTKEVHECSASDLVGQYIGHTGPKTKQLFEKALGKVLFIDEAYRLGEGRFAQEAIDELVGILTHTTFQGKVLVILAGYDQDMNSLMSVNTGLSSRFPEEIIFKHMDPDACLEVLKEALGKQTIVLNELGDKNDAAYRQMWELIEKLSKLPSWGNARDVQTLAKQMATIVLTGVANSFTRTLWKNAQLTLSANDAIKCMETMLNERRSRAGNVKFRMSTTSDNWIPPAAHSSPPPTRAPSMSTSASTQQPPSSQKAPTSPPPPPTVSDTPRDDSSGQRDNGVSDEIWRQLEIDKEAARQALKMEQEEIERKKRELEEAKKQEEAQKQEAQREAERAKARMLALKRKLLEQELARKQRKAEERRQREAAAQTALRQMGVCVQGFQWIKQAGGYRCAGGSHFITDEQLNRRM